MTIQELLRQLPTLSPADLDQVRQRVQLLKGSTSSPAAKKDENDWLERGFEAELQRQGLLAGHIWKNLFPKNWNEKSTAICGYLLKGVPYKLNYAQRTALARLSAELLIEYFRAANIKVSPKLLLSNIEKIPQAFEAAFPGYWAGRMVHFCLRGSGTAWLQKS